MKRRFFPIILAAALLSGCTDNTELGERAIIEAAAIDCTENGYHVSALLFSSGGESIDASKENVIKVTGDGKTLAEAFDNISLTDGKEIFLSEIKLIVLGGGFSDRTAVSAMNTLFYDMRCGLQTPVCCAQNAEMLTDFLFTEGITSAEKPLDMLKNAKRQGTSPMPVLLDILCGAESEKSVLIPMFIETENGYGMTSDDSGETAVIHGSRTMEQGLLTRYNNPEVTQGLLLISGETDSVFLNFFCENTEQTCEAYSVKITNISQASEYSFDVSARFRGRNNAALSEQMESCAMAELREIIALALPYSGSSFA